jgi:hypothetical protein
MSDEIERGQLWAQERTGDRKCPFCDVDDWLPLDSVKGIVIAETPESLDLPVPPDTNGRDIGVSDLTTVKAVAFACKRCGFVRFHMHPDD